MITALSGPSQHALPHHAHRPQILLAPNLCSACFRLLGPILLQPCCPVAVNASRQRWRTCHEGKQVAAAPNNEHVMEMDTSLHLRTHTPPRMWFCQGGMGGGVLMDHGLGHKAWTAGPVVKAQQGSRGASHPALAVVSVAWREAQGA